MSGNLTRDGAAEAEEARSWTCATCDTMVDVAGTYCPACAQYWADAMTAFDRNDDEGAIGGFTEEDCGRWNNGRLTASCRLAGTEDCDWECPIGYVRRVSVRRGRR